MNAPRHLTKRDRRAHGGIWPGCKASFRVRCEVSKWTAKVGFVSVTAVVGGCMAMLPSRKPGRYSMHLIKLQSRRLVSYFVGCLFIASVLQAQQPSPQGEWGQPLGPDYAGPEVRARPVAPAAPLEADEGHTIQIFERAAPS